MRKGEDDERNNSFFTTITSQLLSTFLIMNSNNKDSSPSSNPESSKGKKPLSDVTNTVLSTSPPRGSASPTVAGPSRPPAMLSRPLPMARQAPRTSTSAEPFSIDTYRSEMMQEWRRATAILNDLGLQLSDQHLDPQLRDHFVHHYEYERDRERGFFAELRRLTVPAPGPPLHADPNLVSINSSYNATLAAHKDAWETYNASHQAAWLSHQETLRASAAAYREAVAKWELTLTK